MSHLAPFRPSAAQPDEIQGYSSYKGARARNHKEETMADKKDAADAAKSATEAWQKPMKKAGEAFKVGQEKAAKSTQAVNLKAIDHAEQNAREAFNALRAAAAATSPQEVMEIQRKFIADQTNRGMEQIREFGELIARFGREAVSSASEAAPAKKDKD